MLLSLAGSVFLVLFGLFVAGAAMYGLKTAFRTDLHLRLIAIGFALAIFGSYISYDTHNTIMGMTADVSYKSYRSLFSK